MNGWSPVTVYPHPTRHTWRIVTSSRGEGRGRQVIRAEVHESQVEGFDPAAFWSAR